MAIAQAQRMGQGGMRGGENRKRNTLTNMASKQNVPGTAGFNSMANYKPGGISGGDLPMLDPAMTANYYGQIQSLQSGLMNQLSSLRQARIGFRGDARATRADFRAQGVGAMSEGVNAAIERGMMGSSSDLGARAGVRGAVASGIAGVNRDLYNSLAENRAAATSAALQTQQGIQQVESTALAQRMQMGAQETQLAQQMKIARMGAKASAMQSDAQLAMAQKQLRAQRQETRALEGFANDPTSFYANNPLFASLFDNQTTYVNKKIPFQVGA